MTEASVEPGTVYRKSADTRFRSVGGEGVVVRQITSEVLVVTEVGARVLELVVGRTPVAAVVDALAAEYEIDRPTLDRDTRAYLSELLDAGVIEPVAP